MKFKLQFYALIFLGCLLLTSLNAQAFSVCEAWFDKLKLTNDSDCELKCITGRVDIATFTCHQKCKSLCEDMDSGITFDLLKKYGLTEDEIKICENKPKDCVTAYKDSILAEKACLEIYSSSRTNDESDACRHFVWAILLSKNLNAEKAKEILDAHENNPMEPISEKAMDLANNRLGLAEYQRPIKEGEITVEKILNSFKSNMAKKSIIVIKPKYSKSGGLP